MHDFGDNEKKFFFGRVSSQKEQVSSSFIGCKIYVVWTKIYTFVGDFVRTDPYSYILLLSLNALLSIKYITNYILKSAFINKNEV